MTDPIWARKINTNKQCLSDLWDGTEIYIYTYSIRLTEDGENGSGKLLKA